LHDEQAVQVLTKLLHDGPSDTLRARTAYAFGDFASEARTNPTTGILDDVEARIAIDLLTVSADDPDSETRAASATALVSIVQLYPAFAPKVAPVIFRQLNDPEMTVFWISSARYAWDQLALANPASIEPYIEPLLQNVHTCADVEVTGTLIEALGNAGRVSNDAANAAADLFLSVLLQPDQFENKAAFTPHPNGTWMHPQKDRLSSAAIAGIGRLAPDNPQVARRIVLRLLQAHATQANFKPTIENVFLSVAGSLYEKRKR
jgi:hypothetical protein